MLSEVHPTLWRVWIGNIMTALGPQQIQNGKNHRKLKRQEHGMPCVIHHACLNVQRTCVGWFKTNGSQTIFDGYTLESKYMLQCSPLTSAFLRCFSITILKTLGLSNLTPVPAKFWKSPWVHQVFDSHTSPRRYLLPTRVPKPWMPKPFDAKISMSIPSIQHIWVFQPNIKWVSSCHFSSQDSVHVFSEGAKRTVTPACSHR